MSTSKYDRFSGYAGLFLSGLLAGSLLGAGAMFVLAPNSGSKTRRLLKKQGRKLRNQVNDTMEDTVRPIRRKTRDLMEAARTKAEVVGERGQEILARQKELASRVVETDRKALENLTDKVS
ncbi:MAG: YtxH domain-containing protein [Anaerolineae bacterium]